METPKKLVNEDLQTTTHCKTEVYSRVCGFFRPVQSWNKGKKSEHSDKKTYKVVENGETNEQEAKTRI